MENFDLHNHSTRSDGLLTPTQLIELATRTKVDSIDPRHTATLMDRISANTELLDTLAPLVGLIARERAA